MSISKYKKFLTKKVTPEGNPLYKGMSKENLNEAEFVELLTLLNYDAQQIEQLLPRFRDRELLKTPEGTYLELEAQDQHFPVKEEK